MKRKRQHTQAHSGVVFSLDFDYVRIFSEEGFDLGVFSSIKRTGQDEIVYELENGDKYFYVGTYECFARDVQKQSMWN